MIIYLILFLGMLNWMSYMSSRVLMSLYAIELGASAAAIGLLIALYGLGPLLLSVTAGKVSDRIGTYWPIMLGSLGLASGLAIPYFQQGLEVLYVSALVMGIALVFINISLQHLVASLGGAEQRTRNVSMQSLAISLGAMIGPLLVGVSIDHRGHTPTFLYMALLVSASCLAWIVCRRMIPHSGRAEKPQANGGVRDLWAQSSLRRIMVVSGLVVAGVDLYAFFMPIYGHGVGLSATLIGVVLGAHAAATFVVRTALPLLVRRWGEERVLGASMYLAGATFLLFPFVQDFAVLLLLSFVLGLGLGCGQPLSLIMTYNRSPAGRSGEALGLITVFVANSALMIGGAYANARGAARDKVAARV